MSEWTDHTTLTIQHYCPSGFMFQDRVSSWGADQKSSIFTAELHAMLVAYRFGCRCHHRAFIGASSLERTDP